MQRATCALPTYVFDSIVNESLANLRCKKKRQSERSKINQDTGLCPHAVCPPAEAESTSFFHFGLIDSGLTDKLYLLDPRRKTVLVVTFFELNLT